MLIFCFFFLWGLEGPRITLDYLLGCLVACLLARLLCLLACSLDFPLGCRGGYTYVHFGLGWFFCYFGLSCHFWRDPHGGVGGKIATYLPAYLSTYIESFYGIEWNEMELGWILCVKNKSHVLIR